MALHNDWEMPQIRSGNVVSDLSMGVLRITLLFGSAAVALALIMTPLIEGQVERMSYAAYSGRIDPMATGAIGRSANLHGFGDHRSGSSSGSSYVIRRSVLQPAPASVCIIRSNGMRTGGC